MNVEELSKEAYNGILVEADSFDPELAHQFKLIADESNNESDFLKKVNDQISEIKTYDEEELTDLFYETSSEMEDVILILDKIQNCILKLQSSIK